MSTWIFNVILYHTLIMKEIQNRNKYRGYILITNFDALIIIYS